MWANLRQSYKLRWRRRRLLLRALWARRHLRRMTQLRPNISRGSILAVSVIRNEMERLPHFLRHYRAIGVRHFLIVDNGSDDGTQDYLLAQSDVSLWHSNHSYKTSRFGVDWVNALLFQYGAGHWCVVADADELLVWHPSDGTTLDQLTAHLASNGQNTFHALMLDLYPKGPLNSFPDTLGENPLDHLRWFDPTGYDPEPRPKFFATAIRGGVRRRVFFTEQPDHGPHLNKVPLILWRRRYTYLSSTHLVLPRRLNMREKTAPTGVLLHTKFLPQIIAKSIEEKSRKEHFTYPGRYNDYYDNVARGPVLWSETSVQYTGPEQLRALGLLKSADVTQK